MISARRDSRGFAYLFALLIAATLTTAVLITVDNANVELAMARNRMQSERSEWLARAAVQHAAWRMCYDPGYRTLAQAGQLTVPIITSLPISGAYSYLTSAGGTKEWVITATGGTSGSKSTVLQRLPRTNLGTLATVPCTRDTYLSEQNTTTNYGGSPSLSVRVASGQRRRLLLDFNLVGLPVITQVDAAYVDLPFVSAAGDESVELVAFGMTTVWVEGTKTGSGTSDGATWSKKAATGNWGSAGASNDYTSSGSHPTVLTPPRPGVVRIDVTEVVNGWLGLGGVPLLSQNGIIIRGKNELETSVTLQEDRVFGSRENPDPALRPVLVVQYH